MQKLKKLKIKLAAFLVGYQPNNIPIPADTPIASGIDEADNTKGV